MRNGGSSGAPSARIDHSDRTVVVRSGRTPAPKAVRSAALGLPDPGPASGSMVSGTSQRPPRVDRDAAGGQRARGPPFVWGPPRLRAHR